MQTSTKPVEVTPPPFGSILSYKVVYALCTVGKDGMLKATHYATCLMGGPQPIWGVWTISGKFQRFFGRKSSIADAYPRLVWRQKFGTWAMVDVHEKNMHERTEELKSRYHQGDVLEPIAPPSAGEAMANVVKLYASK